MAVRSRTGKRKSPDETHGPNRHNRDDAGHGDACARTGVHIWHVEYLRQQNRDRHGDQSAGQPRQWVSKSVRARIDQIEQAKHHVEHGREEGQKQGGEPRRVIGLAVNHARRTVARFVPDRPCAHREDHQRGCEWREEEPFHRTSDHIRSGHLMPNKPRPVPRMRAVSSHSARRLERIGSSDLSTGQASKNEWKPRASSSR